MPANEHVPISLDEMISEIATILARDYMRQRLSSAAARSAVRCMLLLVRFLRDKS